MQEHLINYDLLKTFCASLFERGGLPLEHAKTTANALCSATLRGTDSHGIRLIPHYLKCLETGRIDAKAKFVFNRTGAATGTFNANHGMAHAAIAKAMDEAMIMAKETGAGFVSIAHSNHCGAMAPF